MTTPFRPDAATAAASIVAAMAAPATERIPLDQAHGRILGADIFAPLPLPPWTNASMDGYAVRADDIRGATAASPRALRLDGAVRAGETADTPLEPGMARRIFTGAAVPPGADSVVRQEDVRRDGDRVLVERDRDLHANIRPRGGDLASGARALTRGDRIGPAQLGLLAALGTMEIDVCRRPRVGILVTGDEIVPAQAFETIRSGHALGDVNGPMLTALVTEAGGVPVPLGIRPDDPALIREAIVNAPPIDLLLTAGGVSVGDHDHLPAVMAELGLDLRFRRVRLRPGGPTCFGLLPSGLPWLGLPGNPVSAFVTFSLLAAPAIRALAGSTRPVPPRMAVTIDQPLPRDPVLDLWLRVRVEPSPEGGLPLARPTGPQGSGMLTSIAAADALLLIEAGTTPAQAGGWYRVLPCPGWGATIFPAEGE